MYPVETHILPAGSLPADISFIRQICRNDRAMIHEMLQTFLESMADAQLGLDSACREGDADALRKIVHRMKPVLQMYRMEQAYRDAESIQSMAALNQSTAAWQERIPALRSRMEAATFFVKNYLSDNQK